MKGKTKPTPGRTRECILSRQIAKRLAGSRNQKELCKASKESVVSGEVGEGEVTARPCSVFEGYSNTFGFYAISRGNHHKLLSREVIKLM